MHEGRPDNRFGVVVSAQGAWPDAYELRALGASYVRTTITDFDTFDAALRDHPADVRVIALLDTTHPGLGRRVADLATWDALVTAFARRFGGRVWALECLTGWDRQGVDPGVAVACARRASQILRETGSGIACLLGAPVGPAWIASLQEAARLLTAADRGLLAGAAFHLYGRNARGFPGFDHRRFEHGEIDIAVQNAHDIIQLPIWATEFGVTLQQAGGESGQARYVRDAFGLLGALPPDVLAAATYYCWQDTLAGSSLRGDQTFGLRHARMHEMARSGEPRQAWYAFAAAAGGALRPSAVFLPSTPSVCV